MSTLHQGINIDATFGACFIGAQISVMLYGLSTLQSYFYFVSYPEDSRKKKALVSITWFLDTLHVALVSVFLYHHLVKNYDNPPSLAVNHWSLSMSLATNIVIAFFVKCFFAMQIFQLASSRARWWLTSINGFLIVASVSFGFGTFVFTIIEKRRLTDFSHNTLFVSIPFVVFGILSDVLIAGSLCVLLQRNRTENRRTNTAITTLIIYAINRCLLTTALSIVEAIVFLALPNSLWAFAVDFVRGKLYSNSLLAALNSRQAIRATINSTSHMSNIAFVELADLATDVPKAASRPLVLEESIARMRSSSDAPLHSSVDVVHVTKGQGQGVV